MREFNFDDYEIKPDVLQYKHRTYQIVKLSSFIELAEQLKQEILFENKKNQLFFRGQADFNWKLSSNITRKKLEGKEKAIIDVFRNEKPQEYNSNMKYLDILGKMQHYGYPTRLIDFSENPLVALFFACNEEPDKNGRVLIKKGTVDMYLDPPFVNALFAILDKYSFHAFEKPIVEFDSFIDDIVDIPHLKDDKGYSRFLDIFYNWGKRGMVSLPIRSTDRQVNQKAVSIIYPNNLLDSSTEEIIDFVKFISENRTGWASKLGEFHFDESVYVPNELGYNFESIIIPYWAKDTIIKSLQLIGIDESTLFPELEYSGRVLSRNLN